MVEKDKKIPQGVYMIFKSANGNMTSQMKMEKATMADISSAIVWCDLMKDDLFQRIKKIIKVDSRGDFK